LSSKALNNSLKIAELLELNFVDLWN
jgi:hypothetical protein